MTDREQFNKKAAAYTLQYAKETISTPDQENKSAVAAKEEVITEAEEEDVSSSESTEEDDDSEEVILAPPIATTNITVSTGTDLSRKRKHESSENSPETKKRRI